MREVGGGAVLALIEKKLMIQGIEGRK